MSTERGKVFSSTACSTVISFCLLASIHFFLFLVQIFSLNARLAAAESMTHDVIRDLLGVKLDMTTYVVNLSTSRDFYWIFFVLCFMVKIH